MGFSKAYGFGTFQLTNEISKPMGMIWLITCLLFLLSAALFIFRKDIWWAPSLIAILLSQFLIYINWGDAKFGTIANIIILIISIIGYGTWNFRANFKNEVIKSLNQTDPESISLLTESDISLLPEPVKKYIRYTGAINKPKVKNFKIEFTGQIRKDNNSEWMPFTSVQYNFLGASTRLFFMKATMKHLPVAGFHCYKNGVAFMDIRMFSLFKVQYQAGEEMGIAETVTFFNDMCCMAPATLIDKRIQWKEVNGNKVKAEFTNNHITISAWLYFTDEGALTNFISEDRYTLSIDKKMQKIPWSTPLENYKEFNGVKLAAYAETVYQYMSGDFTYGTFKLNNIEYNLTKF